MSLLLLWSIALLLTVGAQPAAASSPYLYVPPKEFLESSPAHRYANLTNAEAYAELDRRGLPYRKVDPIKGVRAPVRLTGKLHGVHIHSSLPEAKRATSIFENLDARLALTLDDFCELLERHDIVEVVHYTMYRPNLPKPGTGRSGKGKGTKKKTTTKGKDKGTRKGSRKGKAPASKKAEAGKKAPKGKKKGAQTLGKGRQPTKQKASAKPHPKKQKGEPKKKGKAPTSKGKAPKSKAAAKGSSKKKATKASKRPTKKTKAATGSSKKSSKGSKGRRSDTKKRGKGKKSKKAADPAKHRSWAPPGTRHPAGLAIDVGGFRKRDGRWISVAHHFQGRIGARTCGATAKQARTPAARELRSIVCEAADLGLFTYVLTPNYDAPHADHFHMEIRGDVRWFLYH